MRTGRPRPPETIDDPREGRLFCANRLAECLGISDRTMRDWYRSSPGMFAIRHGVHYIRPSALSSKCGIDLVDVYALMHRRWVKATVVAADFAIPRRTVAAWCKKNKHFARRIGRLWYIDLDELGASDEDVARIFAATRA